MFNEGRNIGKLVVVIVFILIFPILMTGIAHAVTLGNPFPVAATTGQELALGYAFDGTNYLVGIQGDATQGNKITAQLVSQSGTLVGSRISVGRAGSAPLVAFDGTNYLMVWSDYATYPNNQLYGVFISKDGSVTNPPFVIEEGPLSKSEIGGITFGGGNYMVVYHKIAEGIREAVYGRLISPSGTLGYWFVISTGYGNHGLNNVAFDGTNFFVVWNNNTINNEVRGRFVSPSGTLGTEITVKSSGLPNDKPLTVAFDGTNYLVVWTDQVSGNNWDVFGQLVTPAGALSGGKISISTAPGQQFAPLIAFDWTNYLISWTDMRNDANGNWACDAGEGTCLDIRGQFVSKSGALVGSEFIINNDAGNQLGGFAGQAVNGRLLGMINTGVAMSGTGLAGGDVYSLFMSVSSVNLLDYFPLSVGNRWVYFPSFGTNGNRVDTITGEEIINGIPTYIWNRQEAPDDNYNEKRWIAKDNNGVKAYKIWSNEGPDPAVIIDPPWLLFKSNPNVGDTFIGEFDTSIGIHYKITSIIESVSETVTVPAGTFTNCVRIREKNEMTQNSITTVVEWKKQWYAPIIGRVVHAKYTADWGSATKTQQLTGFSINGLPGDINGDGQITLTDEILALQVISLVSPSSTINKQADINGDQKIGLEDAIYILQALAGLRTTSGKSALNVTKVGNGQGTVTSLPAGIDCGSTCTAQYDSGTPVTLTATASSGSVFAGWSGAFTGQVTMNGNKSVTATFNNNTGPTCTYSISPTNRSFGPSGGPGAVSVTAGTGCTWTATSNSSWITITSGSSGTGNGSVSYTVAVNSGPERNGTITIASRTIAVNQANSINPTSISYNTNGGSGVVNVTAGTSSTWTAISNSDWITITSGNSGTGNGSVSYTVAANNGPERTGTITVAGKTFTVTQSANRPLVQIIPTAITIMLPKNVPQTFTISNIGPQGSSMEYIVADDGVLGGFLDVQNATGTLAGGTSATITISVKTGFTSTGLGSLVGGTCVLNVYTPTAANYIKSFVSVYFVAGYSISGTITTANGTGQPGVNVILSGTTWATTTTTTDANGDYTFASLANGNYTVRPEKTGYSYSPTYIEATVNGMDLTDQNFTATPNLISITLTPDNPTISVGDIIEFTAIGTYYDGSTRDIPDVSIWTGGGFAHKLHGGTSIKVMGVGVSFNPNIGPGVDTIYAAKDGIQGSTNITVTPNQGISGTYSGPPLGQCVYPNDTYCNDTYIGRRITGSFSSLVNITYDIKEDILNYDFSEWNFSVANNTWNQLSTAAYASIFVNRQGQLVGWFFGGINRYSQNELLCTPEEELQVANWLNLPSRGGTSSNTVSFITSGGCGNSVVTTFNLGTRTIIGTTTITGTLPVFTESW